MVYNLKKMFGKRSITFILILSFVFSTFYSPVITPIPIPRAQAFLGFGDTTWDIPAWVKRLIDAVGTGIAQAMIDRIVRSTIKWAQSGFQGNPAYVIDPRQYFTDLADGVAGEFILGSELGFLCSPFQTQVRLALQRQYAESRPFQCTLTGVVGNIDAFYSDFSQGGWDGWFVMTQNNANNPYGAFINAQVELDSRLADAIGLENKKLDWDRGFRSFTTCKPGKELTEAQAEALRQQGMNFNAGDCREDDKQISTPGSVIQEQLNEVLPSGLKKLQVADSIDQLITAFANGLLTRYVFGPKGLFAQGSGSGGGSSGLSTASDSRSGKIYLQDRDDIPDGQDVDQDLKLESSVDVCFHGGRAEPPPAPGCTASQGLTSSPYFTPICQAVGEAVINLTDFTNYIDLHADYWKNGAPLQGLVPYVLTQNLNVLWTGGVSYPSQWSDDGVEDPEKTADAQILAGRVSAVVGSLDAVMDSITTYNAPYFDDIESITNNYKAWLEKVLESVYKDSDLDLSNNPFGAGSGGLRNLMIRSAEQLLFQRAVKAEFGECRSPEISGLSNLPTNPPSYLSSGGGTGSTGNTCDTCAEKGQTDLYQSDVRNAANQYLSANPQLANLSSATDLNAVAQLRDGTIAILISQGFNAEKSASPDPYANGEYFYPQMVNIWRNSDPDKTVYRITAGGGVISVAISAGYCGGHLTFSNVDIIPNSCLLPGGGGTGGGTGGGGTTVPQVPSISSISPTSVISGQTVVTIYGANLKNVSTGAVNVQFFDSAGTRNTVAGSANSSGTQATARVPSGMALGTGSVRLDNGTNLVSNSVSINVTGSGTISAPPPIIVAQKTLGTGFWPDVAWYNGKVWYAVPTTSSIKLYNANSDLTGETLYKEVIYSIPGLAFARLSVSGNALWMAYQDGDNHELFLWRSDTNITESLGPIGGLEGAVLGYGYVAWQTPASNYPVYRRSLTGGTRTYVKNGASGGLSRVLANGDVKTLFEDRSAVSGMIGAWFAGNITVGEDPNYGVLGFYNNDRTTDFGLWSGTDTLSPHPAFNGTNLYAVITWSQAGGGGVIRLAILQAP
ncbi:MAG: hypothetical protein A3D56_01845 [Candidatus Taylorbacteria bacterium RIFCSPHIGHO2_02_FULL_45_35]|uniref:IPT/TIG domain-containing protein n=2 Tax=Parcubacteria group TaxID=1794811 RepID=A0A1G2MRD4_9BACT|nr:MAG: hypothetical protein A3D56_01845 [Candidatus Taylorbacteria bacterium RIFCSPHIGHO2_02_FULL_45_35]